MRSLVAACLLAPLLAAPAYADAIDGHWCHDQTHRRIEISGPSIVTPSGARIDGSYTRHAFSYVVPAKEPGAGQTVAMTLLNEVTVRVDAGPGANEIWVRCAPPTSLRDAPADNPRTGNG